MVIVYSATKGLAAMTLAIAHSRGWLNYEEHVCTYWPEFAQQGKERVTVRQLLARQAGLYTLDEPLDRQLVADLGRLAAVITLGFYEGELLRRIDPRHRSLGQFFEDEIASPLGLDFYIRLPNRIPNTQLAVMTRPTIAEMLHGFPPRFACEPDGHAAERRPTGRRAERSPVLSSCPGAGRAWTTRCMNENTMAESHGIPYGFEQRLPGVTFSSALERVTAALQKEGFGVLTEINVAATLKSKLGVDMPSYVILGACNPALAHQALSLEPQIGLLLPCNVVVHQTANGEVVASIADPRAMFAMVDDARMAPIVDGAERRLRRVIRTVATGDER